MPLAWHDAELICDVLAPVCDVHAQMRGELCDRWEIDGIALQNQFRKHCCQKKISKVEKGMMLL
jgi:hypothetical protein